MHFTCTVSVQQRPPVARDALCYPVWGCWRGRGSHLFFLECSSFPFFTPKILVISVLKRSVEEFLTWQNRGEKSHQSPKTTDTERRKSRLGIRIRSELTAQTGEVKPSTAACIPSETKGTMFSPRRVSLYRALRMLSAWTCSDNNTFITRAAAIQRKNRKRHEPAEDLRDVGAVAARRRHGQSHQLPHGHLQQAAAGCPGLRGEQGLREREESSQV